ncbi:MAG: hypothetical protein OES69_01150 [Myxococcales bacterium]|nr:hypothetical protein [Myxococcales bacterium]MDH3842515.1 hypothetical protein [Myxococcales bacterium]
MKARALSTLAVAALLGFGVSAGAQEEDKPERPPPTTGALPFDDPTIEPPRDEDLQIEQTPDAELAQEADEPGRAPIEPEKLDTEAAESPAPHEDEGPDVKVVYDEAFLLSVNDWFTLTLGGLVQARYTLNYRTEPPTDIVTLEREKQVAQGFDVARARFQLGIGLTEFVALYMRIGVVAGGSFSFQKAFIDLKWKYFRVRAGVFMVDFIAEDLLGPTDLYFLDYSIVENVYSPGSSKGAMFTYLRDRFSINLGYSDGLRTGFSEIRAPINADFAFTVRAQYAWGEAGLAGFNRLTTRRGEPFGIRLGGALHYQQGGRTQGSLPVRIGLGTVDLSMRGSGWSVLLSGNVGQDAVDASATDESGEILSGAVSLTGGAFVSERVQVFGRYAIVIKPRIQGVLPPGLPDEIIGLPSNFQSFGFGFSYFILPRRDNVKVSSDFNYFLGRERGSLVPTSPLNSIQPNDAGSQFAWRVQLSGRF